MVGPGVEIVHQRVVRTLEGATLHVIEGARHRVVVQINAGNDFERIGRRKSA